MPPKLQSIGNGVKVDMTVIALELHELVFHYFNEVDTDKRTILRHRLFHFLNEVTTKAKLSSGVLVSFFNELDTRQGTVLQPNFIITNGKLRLPRVPLWMEGQHLGSQGLMPPGRCARRRHHWIQAWDRWPHS